MRRRSGTIILVTSDATVLIATLPVGWIGDWHDNPKPQWIVPLSGCWFVETTDGTRVEMGPGEISFGGDQNAKPDAPDGSGHRSGTVGDAPAVLMVVQLNDEKWVAARPGAFVHEARGLENWTGTARASDGRLRDHR